MKIEEIYVLPVEGNGWRVLPTAIHVKRERRRDAGQRRDGDYVTLGERLQRRRWAIT